MRYRSLVVHATNSYVKCSSNRGGGGIWGANPPTSPYFAPYIGNPINRGVIRNRVKKEVESRITKPITIKFTQPEASTSGAKRTFSSQHARQHAKAWLLPSEVWLVEEVHTILCTIRYNGNTIVWYLSEASEEYRPCRISLKIVYVGIR